MPLSPEEQAEFAQLSQKYGQPQAQPQSGGLSPQEQAEFAQLRQKYGNTPQPQNFEANSTTASTSPTSGPSELQSQTPPMGPRGDAVMMQQYGAAHPGALSPAMSVAGGMLLGPSGAIGGAALGSAAANAATNYNHPGTALRNVAEDTAINGVLPEVGGKVIGAIGSGGGKFADWLQRLAMGVRKGEAGAGQAALDAGVWGTRARMQSKMAQALSQAGQKVGDAVANMNGTVDSTPVAQKVAGLAKDYGGDLAKPSLEAQPVIRRISRNAEVIAGRGEITPSDAQKYKLAAQAMGYNMKGKPLESVRGIIPQTEAFGYGEQLSKLNPDYAPANEQYSNLMPGAQALATPESVHGITLRDLMVGGGIGSILHNPGYAVPAIAAERLLSTPAVGSTAAKGISGLAKFLQGTGKATPNLIRMLQASEDDNGQVR